MQDQKRLEVVFLWHMHQPEYRDYATGEFTQPWVYLHAIKDYADMAAHLERHPGVRAAVNFVPVLADQLEDYAGQFAAGRFRDPLLRVLAHDPATPLTAGERSLILDRCFHANHEKMVQPYQAYRGLHELFASLERQGRVALDYLSDQYFHDLVTWYHLVWTGETVRRDSALVTRLMAAGMGFTFADRKALLALLGDVVRDIIPRYARLAASGRVELATSPHFHPLAPLMLDFQSAREVWPDLPLPGASGYPGGTGRVTFHIQSALESHSKRFGVRATGMWPSEGAVSAALLRLFSTHGARWTATGEGVLLQSLRAASVLAADRARYLYRPYRVDGLGITCFFRDDRLSDLIGFEYAKWHSRDAAANLVGELERIAADARDDDPPLVSVILDGENCWEYYPYNGFYFLDELYGMLERHPYIRTTTYADTLRAEESGRPRPQTGTLPRVVAGSWVHGDFTTWIGSAEKNRAWDLLCAAKASFDLVVDSGPLAGDQRAAALRQLAACEGSDWFWWMGDYNPVRAVARFDSLFRQNLRRLYELLGLPSPASLDEPISRGGGHPETGGAMRRAS
ncbi:MAG TPA: glycoside hydrolase family 57 protein [Burkholderiales bacterium]|nr:glycoside hydrolase family 57 protein [Burkholderiales bacterium]